MWSCLAIYMYAYMLHSPATGVPLQDWSGSILERMTRQLAHLVSPIFTKGELLCDQFSESCGRMVQNYVSNKIFGPTYATIQDDSYFSNPEQYGLQDVRQLYIGCVPRRAPLCTTTYRLGAWMIEPTSPYKGITILHLHGVYDTRAAEHRIEMYKFLQSHGYRILTIDYRGFADSAPVDVINQNTTVEDTQLVISWLSFYLAPQEKLVIWAHSMGTAIGTIAVAKLPQHTRSIVRGIILEAPYNNFMEQLEFVGRPGESVILQKAVHVISRLRVIRGFEFATDKWIGNIDVPVLLLHAEDDDIVPIQLARKLYSSAKQAGVAIWMEEFPAEKGYGHSHIYKDPINFPRCVTSFLSGIISGGSATRVLHFT